MFSGIKDKKAIVIQKFCFKTINPTEILRILENYRNIKIIDHYFSTTPLRIGTHHGNLFKIKVFPEKDISNFVYKKLKNWRREFFFLNLYGDQRFGNNDSTYKTGLTLGKNKKYSESFKKFLLYSLQSKIFNSQIKAKHKEYIKFLNGELESCRYYLYSELKDKGLSTESISGNIHSLENIRFFLKKGYLYPLLPLVTENYEIPEGKIKKLFKNTEKIIKENSILLPKSQYRAAYCLVKDFKIEVISRKEILFEFTLNKGSYATEILSLFFDIFIKK